MSVNPSIRRVAIAVKAFAALAFLLVPVLPAAAQRPTYFFDAPATLSTDYSFAQQGIVRVGFNNPNPFTVNVVNGANVYEMYNYNASVIEMTGGNVKVAGLYNDAQFNIYGGVMSDGLALADNAKAEIHGGIVGILSLGTSTGENPTGKNNANASIYDGDVHSVGVHIGGTLNVYGGTINGDTSLLSFGSVNVFGGTISSFTTAYTGISNVNGGQIGFLEAVSGGTTNLFDGTVDRGFATDSGIINVYGGTISRDTLYNYKLPLWGVYNLFGTNFNVANPQRVTVNNEFGNRDGVMWDVTGTLFNGNRLDTRYFEEGGDISATARLNLINASAAPEPDTLVLLGIALPLAGVAMRRRGAGR